VLPRVILERTATPAGEMVLARRGDEFSIRVAGVELMNSYDHKSELELGRIAGELVRAVAAPRLLIGGLGMGYTLRATLDVVPAEAHVDVAELLPAVVRWNRTVYGQLAGHPLDDPRVHVIEGDVVHVIAASPARYDAIVLDVDNGPDGVFASNAILYQQRGLAVAAAALAPGGALAVWSSFESPTFTRWLHDAGFAVELRTIQARHGKHYIWLARGR
jgi:spermidine synthase